MLARKVLYPFEIDKAEIDLSGNILFFVAGNEKQQ